MTRAEYMKRLEAGLSGLPPERLREVLDDIDAHFDEGMVAEYTEETLAEGLGTPEVLAREFKAEYAVDRAQEKPSFGNYMRVFWAAIGMGLLYLLVIIPVVAVLAALWLSLLAVGIALSAVGIVVPLLVLSNFFIPWSFVEVVYPWFTLAAAVALGSLGGLICIYTVRAGMAMGRRFAQGIQRQIDKMKGRRVLNAA